MQHLLKILKPQNDSSLIFCNMLSNDTWYDTYSYIIDIFFSNNNIPNYFKKYFTRNSLKKTIMIENYGASKFKCYNDFLSNIKIDDQSNLPQIKSIFNLLFDQLRKQEIGNIYTNNFNKLKKNNDIKFIIFLNDGDINLKYYTLTKHQLSYKSNSFLRNTFQELILTNNIDKKKSETAFKANITHASDGEICRRMYLKNFQLYTVHDCFLIDIFQINKFIDQINNEFWKSAFLNDIFKSNKEIKIYSPFIII